MRATHLFLTIPIFLLVFTASNGATATINDHKRVITGVALNERGDSVGYISIKLKGTKDGGVTNSRGIFTITTSQKSVQNLKVTLVVKNLAYEPFEQEIILEGDTTRANIHLLTKVVNLKGATVSASAFTSGDVEGVTLKPLEIVTTPGAAADIFRALQTFPGVTSPDEGSGLIVRGGDITETITLIDQASVAAPYRAQAPNGGTFGFIPPFFVSGTFFSSGGMPARYGNALSGVVALESLGMPSSDNELTAVLSTGGVSLRGASQIVPGVLGIRASGNYSNTDILFRLNGLRERFTQPPVSIDANISLLWKYSSTGKIKVFNYGSENGLQTFYGFGSSQNTFTTAQRNSLHNIQVTDVWQDWVIKSSLSANSVRTEFSDASLSVISEQFNLKSRTDIEKDVSDWVRVLAGAEAEYDDLTATKVIAQGGTETRYSSQGDGVRVGIYAETEWKLTRNLLAGIGVRSDYHTVSRELVFDPRISLKYVFTSSFNVRAAFGVFHQFGRPDQLQASLGGNPNLHAQQATHYILGAEYTESEAQIRAEVYNKSYANLILPATDGILHNLGYGYARGLDFFAKYGEYLKTDFNGWLSYSLLETNRLQARRTQKGIVYEEGATPFDIRHNIVLVGKIRVWEGLSIGATARYSTGRAITPIVGGIMRSVQGYSWFDPIDGNIGSERLPEQMRFDVDVSYFLPFSNNAFLVLFASLSNATGRANVLGYTYSPDYSQREPTMSLHRQFIFLGATATVRL